MSAILLSFAIFAGGTAQLPPPEPLPTPQSGGVLIPAPIQPPPIAVEQFAKNFVPTPGIHDVKFIQPYSKKPIDVVFRLPDAPLFKTYYSKNRITFDYGRTKVALIFRLIGGKVDVRYD
jgi:hypothetical protein